MGGLEPLDGKERTAMAESPGEPESGGEARSYKGPVILLDRFLIDLNSPLPEFDSPSAKAYMAEDRQDLGRKLMALVCTPGLPPRVDVMNDLMGVDVPGLLPLVDWDTLVWPPLGQRCLLVVYERPLGGRLLTAFSVDNVPGNKQDLPKRIIESASSALLELSNRNISHRAIRPSNLFFMDEGKSTVVLGE